MSNLRPSLQAQEVAVHAPNVPVRIDAPIHVPPLPQNVLLVVQPEETHKFDAQQFEMSHKFVTI